MKVESVLLLIYCHLSKYMYIYFLKQKLQLLNVSVYNTLPGVTIQKKSTYYGFIMTGMTSCS